MAILSVGKFDLSDHEEDLCAKVYAKLMNRLHPELSPLIKENPGMDVYELNPWAARAAVRVAEVRDWFMRQTAKEEGK